jgi:hypothetical protein
VALQTDEPVRTHLDEFLRRIDELVSPVFPEHEREQQFKRLQLLRARFEHALIDLELVPTFNITVELERSSLALRGEDQRAQERLLAFLEDAASQHNWGTSP